MALRDYCIEYGADSERISVDYAGLDFERFHPGEKDPSMLARYGLSPDDKIVLFMGTFYRFAGLDWFIEEFADHLRTHSDVKLMLVGGGEYDSELRVLVDRLDLESSVIFTGFVEYGELADHLRLADVGITPFQPKLATDCALVTKVIQYVASGIPTVSTPLAGTMGLLAEGEGVLYREVGLDFCAEVVRLLFDDAGSTELLVDAGLATLRRSCCWDSSLAGFEGRIKQVRLGMNS